MGTLTGGTTVPVALGSLVVETDEAAASVVFWDGLQSAVPVDSLVWISDEYFELAAGTHSEFTREK